MLPEFITPKTIYLIIHVFGAIIGAGGAFISDIMFFKTVKDGIIENTELSFMKLGSKIVWFGISILVISGLFLFFTNPEVYLASSKFMVKVTVVGIIILNGIIFHLIHLPHISKHTDLVLKDSPSFIKKSSFLMVSGAISMVSWVFTVILGMLKTIPYSYMQIFGFYLVVVILAIIGALVTKNKILHLNK